MDKEPARDEEQTAPQESAQDEKMDSYQPIVSHTKSGKKKLIIAAVIIVIVLIALMLAKSFFGSQPVPTQTPVPTPAPSPTPVSKQQLVRPEWNLEVLNGSGTTGLAKKVAERLRELGYKVVKTGNADRDDYELSQILVSSDFKNKVDLLVEDIKDVIKIASVAGELKDATASARIIIGKN